VRCSITFLVVRRVLRLLGIGPTADDQDVEIAVLGHQSAILRRQVPRPRYSPTDRGPPGPEASPCHVESHEQTGSRVAVGRISSVRDERREALGVELRSARRRFEDLRRELDAIDESTEQTPDDEHDPDGSTIGYERARVTGLLARARDQVASCEAALGRLRAGDYGVCISCHASIPEERLSALPATTVCVTCSSGSPVHASRPRRENLEEEPISLLKGFQ
jgi:DnaK suppressor protein